MLPPVGESRLDTFHLRHFMNIPTGASPKLGQFESPRLPVRGGLLNSLPAARGNNANRWLPISGPVYQSDPAWGQAANGAASLCHPFDSRTSSYATNSLAKETS